MWSSKTNYETLGIEHLFKHMYDLQYKTEVGQHENQTVAKILCEKGWLLKSLSFRMLFFCWQACEFYIAHAFTPILVIKITHVEDEGNALCGFDISKKRTNEIAVRSSEFASAVLEGLIKIPRNALQKLVRFTIWNACRCWKHTMKLRKRTVYDKQQTKVQTQTH